MNSNDLEPLASKSPEAEPKKAVEGSTLKIRELKELEHLYTKEAREVLKKSVPKVLYEEDVNGKRQLYMCQFLCCQAPSYFIGDAGAALIQQFNDYVDQGLAVSILQPLATIELANPSAVDLQWYEMFEKVAPEKVRGKPKPVLLPFDKHAVFIFFHVKQEDVPVLQRTSQYLVREGEIGPDYEVPRFRENEM